MSLQQKSTKPNNARLARAEALVRASSLKKNSKMSALTKQVNTTNAVKTPETVPSQPKPRVPQVYMERNSGGRCRKEAINMLYGGPLLTWDRFLALKKDAIQKEQVPRDDLTFQVSGGQTTLEHVLEAASPAHCALMVHVAAGNGRMTCEWPLSLQEVGKIKGIGFLLGNAAHCWCIRNVPGRGWCSLDSLRRQPQSLPTLRFPSGGRRMLAVFSVLCFSGLPFSDALQVLRSLHTAACKQLTNGVKLGKVLRSRVSELTQTGQSEVAVQNNAKYVLRGMYRMVAGFLNCACRMHAYYKQPSLGHAPALNTEFHKKQVGRVLFEPEQVAEFLDKNVINFFKHSGK